MSSIKIVFGIVAIFIIIAALCFGITVFINRGTIFPAPQTRPISDFYATIDKNIPTLTKNGNPVYKIVSANKLAKNWYDVSIETADQSTAPGLQSQVVIFDPYQSANYMQVQAGPEAVFSHTELIGDSVPSNVVNTIIKAQS